MQGKEPTEKGKKWTEYEALEYVISLREEQKENPTPLVLRAKINDLACELYLDGYTCLEISKLLSMGKPTVYKVLQRNNIFEKQDRSIPKEVEENVVCMYKAGEEASDISEQLGITIPSVRWILKKNKVPAHRLRIIIKKEKPDKNILAKAVDMYREGILHEQIKTELGINNNHLYEAIHKSGAPLRGGCKVKTKQRIAAEKKAIDLYRDTNTPVDKITKETGIAFTSLNQLLKRRNIPLRTQHVELSEEQKDEVARLYSEGWTNKAICEKTGIGPARFALILKEKNIPLKGRRQSAVPKELQEKAIRMYQDGCTIKEITDETGVKYIYDVLKRYNIDKKQRE